MSILASLVRAYDRMPDAPPFRYSSQNIGVIVGLNVDGSVASVTDWRDGEGNWHDSLLMELIIESNL